MLYSIEEIDIKEDIFSNNKLGIIPSYINSISTFTVIFVFTHVYSYYHAPFGYASVLGETVRISLLLPAVLAIPVVAIFNFYPKSVLKTLYEKSINNKMNDIRIKLSSSRVTEYERLICLMEYDKMTKDELKHRLKLTLGDLPIVVTIIFMVLRVIF